MIILTLEVLDLEGKPRRGGIKGRSVARIMERALVGLYGPLPRLLGNLRNVRIAAGEKDYKTPAVSRVISEPESSKYPKKLIYKLNHDLS